MWPLLEHEGHDVRTFPDDPPVEGDVYFVNKKLCIDCQLWLATAVLPNPLKYICLGLDFGVGT